MCYALALAKRLKAMGLPKYQTDGDPRTSGPGFGLAIHPEVLDLPYRWRGGRMVFVNSMSDLFHDKVPAAFIRSVFATMEATPRHTYQVLTKRSRRLTTLAPRMPWPANIWMGVSVENDRYTFRVDHLLGTDAAVKFASVEPMLGPVPSLNVEGLDWVIAGGESGVGARPIDPVWVRDLRDRCVDAGVSFFFKQWGGRTPKAGGRALDGELWDQMPQVS
jgi:protein gp37